MKKLLLFLSIFMLCVGDTALNLKLSEERAKTVVDYLVQKGISSSRLTYQGFGGTRPITNEDTAEAHAKNRRVVFIIIRYFF